MIELAEGAGFADLLAARGDPMAACSQPWMKSLQKVPKNAAPPLAMSPPHPRAVGSYGPACIKWAQESMGITLRWWQALAVTRQLEHDKAGALVWREIVESGPRRIGKSVRLRVTALWRSSNPGLLGETQLTMLVSKDLAVGKEIHRGAWRWADQKGWGVLRLNGAQEIESPDGDRWLLRAPNAVYGYDVGYGQVDESWGVDPAAITDGLEPALLERCSPQLHLTSTAHVKASSLMRRRLTAALRDADEDTLLLLWGAHPDTDPADESLWPLASPHWSADRLTLMRRKYVAALAGVSDPEFDDPDPVRGWAAQYLNKWPLMLEGGQAAHNVFGPAWAATSTSRLPQDIMAVGVGVSVDRVWASIAACGFDTDGVTPIVGAAARKRGTTWILPELKRLQDKYDCVIAVARGGPAGSLVPHIEEMGLRFVTADANDAADSAAHLYDRIQAGEVLHAEHDDLDAAVRGAKQRMVGDGRWAWGRRSSTNDVSMLEAATLAHWFARSSVYEERELISF